MVKVCKKCNIEKPATVEYFVKAKECKNGIAGICRKCESVRSKEYWKRNKEKLAEKSKEYYKLNKDHILEHNKLYRKENKESISEHKKSYREKNQEHIKKILSAYYAEHREEASVKGKIYREANKERINKRNQEYAKRNRHGLNVNNHNYRAKRRSLPSTLTGEQWNTVVKYFDNKCAYCGEEKPLAQEHFYPMALGGEYGVSNIVCACKRCNGSKGARSFFTWYPKQSYYNKSREVKILSYLKYKNNVQQLAFA